MTGEPPLANGLTLRRESTADQVAALLREQILTGRLGAGVHLREASLSEALGVSRNTTREAIQMLVGQGLVTRNMHRGAFVKRLSADDVRDVYRVRRLVELAAIADAARPGADRSALRDAVAKLAAAAEADDLAAIVEHDLAFHLALVVAMRSPRLQALYEAAEGETRLCLALEDSSLIDADQLVAEHREVLGLLEAHDEERARALLRAHLDAAEASIVEIVEREAAAD